MTWGLINFLGVNWKIKMGVFENVLFRNSRFVFFPCQQFCITSHSFVMFSSKDESVLKTNFTVVIGQHGANNPILVLTIVKDLFKISTGEPLLSIQMSIEKSEVVWQGLPDD